MAAFGWSVGDLVAAATVIAKITKALKDTGGASSQYQQTIQDLEALEIILRYLQDIKPSDANFAFVNAICARSQASQHALRDLIDGFKKFDKSLGHAASEGWFRGPHRKAQWALFASKELKQLHAIIGPQLQSLGLLLQAQQLNAITSSSEALASKATEQVGLMKELKDDLGDLRRSGHATKVREMKVAQSIMDGSREAQAMLRNLKNTTDGIRNAVAIDRKLVVQGRQDADQQAVHIMSSLQDIKQDVKYAADMLGNMMQENRLVQHKTTGPGRRVTPCYSSLECPPQTAVAEAAEHLIQLLYLVAIGTRELLKMMILLYPRLVLLFRICYVMIPRSPTRLLEGNIQFRDALGRTTSLEYTIFKSWNVRTSRQIAVFNAFLQDQFRECPGEYHVLRRKFHLFNAQRQKDLISDEEWSTKVAPGTTVLMSVGLEQFRGTSVTCPRPSCKGVTISCNEKVSMQCLTCLLVFHPQTARYELQPCSTPLCTGILKVFESTTSTVCLVCSARSFSDTSMNNTSHNNLLDGPPLGPRIVDITDEADKSFIEATNVELQMSLELEDQDPSTPSDLFQPILMDRPDVALSTYSGIKPPTLESKLLRLQRMKLENRRVRLERLHKEQLERDDLRQRQREENDIKSLKMIHLLDDEDGEMTPSGERHELSPAKKLFEARLRLFENMKRQQITQTRPMASVDSEPFTRLKKDCTTATIIYDVPLPKTDNPVTVTVGSAAPPRDSTPDHMTPPLDIPVGPYPSDLLWEDVQVSESESITQEHPFDPRSTDEPWAEDDFPIPARVGMVISIENNGDLLPNDKGHSNHRLERTFIVIRTGEDYNICLKTSTYDGLGTTKPHVDSSKHALIYTAKRRPYVLPEESEMKPAIAVTMSGPLSAFDPMSRVSFAKVYNISCRARWSALGRIQGESLQSLERSFSQCFQTNFDLSHAASEGREKSVIRLLADGADPNAIVGIRGNALHGAVMGGHYRVAEILLAKGAAPYLGFAEKMVDPPLHAAIMRRATGVVKALTRRSICSTCYQESNQKAVAETAARALLGCADPLEHLRKLPMPSAQWWPGYFGDRHGYHPLKIMEASLPFCPQLWPLLVFLQPPTISEFRGN